MNSVVDRMTIFSAYRLATGATVVPNGKREQRVRCPSRNHADAHASCDMNSEKNTFCCRSCDASGGVLDLLVVAGCARNRAEAARWLETQLALPCKPFIKSPSAAESLFSLNDRAPESKVVAAFDYVTIDDVPARVDRVEPGRGGRPKEFFPYLNGASKPGLHGKTLHLYHVDEARAAITSGARLWVVEGESKCDVLRAALGEADDPPDAATTIAGGSNAKLTPEHLSVLKKGRSLVVLPDSDEVGRKAAREHADAILRENATCDMRVVDLFPERSDGSDVGDWFSERHTLNELRALVEATPRHELNTITDDTPVLATVRADDVFVRRTEWFARDRIPFGALTLLDGPGGIGKTTLWMGVIGEGTLGRSFFDGTAIEPLSVLVVAEEDTLGHLKAKLALANADMARVVFVTDDFVIPGDVERLGATIRKHGARLVYVDALFSHLDLPNEGVRPQQVRAALRPLIKMLDRAGCALLCVRHWTKAAGPATARALGSAEFTNVARSVMTCGPNPERDGSFVVAPTKMNLSIKPPAIAYRLEAVDSIDDEGKPWQVTQAVLEGEVQDVTSDDLAMRVPDDPDERNAVDDWLADYLADGKPYPCATVCAKAREAHIARATLYRSARRLGVRMERHGPGTKHKGQSTWTLFSRETSETSGDNETSDAVETLDLSRSSHQVTLVSRLREYKRETSGDDGVTPARAGHRIS